MITGKGIRIERIINRETKKTVIVPLDHGVTMGPIPGLIDMPRTVEMIAEGGANAVLGHIGLARFGHRGYGRDIGLILHLSGSTVLGPDPNAKVLINDVETALKFGADAVSIHINLGAQTESQMIEALGAVALDCIEWGVPLVAMMYCRGPKVESEFDAKAVKHAARVAAELGADIAKVNYTGSPESFHEVVEGCPIPVVIAGGEKMESDLELLQMVEGAMKAGGKGVSIGRNVFQHKNPGRVVQAISTIVHEGRSVEEARKILGKEEM